MIHGNMVILIGTIESESVGNGWTDFVGYKELPSNLFPRWILSRSVIIEKNLLIKYHWFDHDNINSQNEPYLLKISLPYSETG